MVNVVSVKVSETYDLCTVPNKLGLIGVHTPRADIISRNYPGLLMNYSKVKITSCNVTLACASILPADPLQIGTEAGEISPQDMFNPILYRAMTNASMSMVEKRLWNALYTTGSAVDVNGSSALLDADSISVDAWKAYYGLLSNRHGWKTALPQQGLSMNNLVPLVHEKLYAYGDMNFNGTDSLITPTGGSTVDSNVSPIANNFILGNAKPMPAFPCTTIARVTAKSNLDGKIYSTTAGVDHLPSESGLNSAQMSPAPLTGQSTMPYYPDIFVACIVMPPSKLKQLFYRLQVTWTLDFYEPRPLSETMDFNRLAEYGDTVYNSNYITAGNLSKSMNTVDVSDGLDIEQVM